MSESPGNGNNKSNKDIIDELTKKIKNDFTENPDSKEDFVIEHKGSSQDNVPPDNSSFQYGAEGDFKVEEDDDDECDGEESKDDHDDDGTDDEIDETQLKDAEMDMTDDQKEERRIIAEELKIAGNNAYKDGEFARSAEKYTEGLRICPLQFTQQRAVLFCNRSAAKMKMEKYKKAAADCTKAIELDDKYLKAYIRRAQSYEEQEKFDESLADYKKILELDPSHQEAKKATIRLPPLIEEKNEKLKHEMLGKLKDLGNMILKPFGLSTENFQLEQDAGTKGYKINFKQ